MSRYKNQLAGLSLPINVFSVLVHLLSVFTIICSQLKCCDPFEQLMLWIGVPALTVSLVIIILFRGYYLLVQHARLTVGFILLILSLVHIAAISDFYLFLSASGTGKNNPYAFLQSANYMMYILAVVEFVVAMALIIGARIQLFSSLIVLLFAFYAGLFWYHPVLFSDGRLKGVQLTFGLDSNLIGQLNWNTAMAFCLFMMVIGLVGVIFGNKIRSNSVRLNWAIIPVYTLLAAALAIVFHWYQLIFIVPVSISLCLITYRSGGKLLGNHFGAMLVAAIMAITMTLFSNELGLAEKQTSVISLENKR